MHQSDNLAHGWAYLREGSARGAHDARCKDFICIPRRETRARQHASKSCREMTEVLTRVNSSLRVVLTQVVPTAVERGVNAGQQLLRVGVDTVVYQQRVNVSK